MKQRLKKVWQSLKIKQKLTIFTRIVFFMILLSVFLAVWTLKYYIVDFFSILDSNSIVTDFVQCVEAEADLFELYARSEKEETYARLEKAISDTGRIVGKLPFDYEKIGQERYAKTWSILNMYEVYCEKRDKVIGSRGKNSEYITDLYEVYDIQTYLLIDAKQLMRDTLESGVDIYMRKVGLMMMIPLLLILFEVLLLVCIGKLSEFLNRSIVAPITELAKASHKIAENDFFIDDIKVQSEDELGELVVAFNKMKYATGEYIKALEERRKALDLYHAEEMEKLEIAARLDAMELDLLKSQINPHFLFNTLNVIGGMANLEGAQTTEAMIQSLSSLFRYNLKTPEEEVPLARELKIVKDYMFIQEMRFGGRIAYEIDCRADAEIVLIPTFTFQPLVENAIIHGLAPKEDGGRILIRIRKRQGMICIVIADNGIGMKPEELRALRKNLNEDKPVHTKELNIGLFNIYKRIRAMYDKGAMLIHSKYGSGTIVRICLSK